MEILNAFLAETYQIGEEEIASLYEDDKTTFKADAVQKLKEFDINRISNVKGDIEKIKKDQYQKGFSEGAGKSEKIISEKFGFKSEKKGEEFFSEFGEHFKSTAGATTLTDEDVRKHRAYLDDREKINKEWEEKYAGLETEHNTFKSGVEREKSFFKVREKADVLLKGYNLILPKDPQKAQNQLGWFHKELSETNFRQEGDKFIVLDKDGVTDLQDGHGNRVPFDKYVKSISDKYFEYSVATPRSTPGNGGDTGGQGGNDDGEDFAAPTTKEEYSALILKHRGNAKMITLINKSWDEQQKK